MIIEYQPGGFTEQRRYSTGLDTIFYPWSVKFNLKTSRRFNLLKCHLDETPALNLDNGWNIDCDFNSQTVIEAICDLAVQRFVFKELNLDCIIESECTLDAKFARFLDFLQLIPECFRDSELLKDYLKQIGIIFGGVLTNIDDLPKLVNPGLVGDKFIDQLAALIGLKLVRTEDTTILDLRNQLEQAIDWYKIRGTYKSLDTVALINNFTVNILDMYTNDYIVFNQQPWFVGAEGENPPGLDSTFFKSPHFGIEILLDKVRGTFPNEFLWKGDLDQNIKDIVEDTRPVNTVPCFIIRLDAITTEGGLVFTTNAKVKTLTTANFNFTALNLDMGTQLGSAFFWNLDDGSFLDSSDAAFLSTITKFKLAIGNMNESPDDSGFILAQSVIEGNISKITSFPDRNEFDIRIPKNIIQKDISSLGLFLGDNTTQVAVSTFPKIEKTSGIEIFIKVTIFN